MPPHHGGVERVAQQLSRWYGQAGHEVTWVATDGGGGPLAGQDGPVELRRVPAFNGLERWRGMPFPIPSPFGLGPLRDAVRRSDIVHLHDCLYLTSLAADAAARRAGVPTIVTQHVAMVAFGGAVDAVLDRAYRTIGRRVLRRAARVSFVNAGVQAWFRTHVDRDLSSDHIPNAVDLTRFHPAGDGDRAAARRAFGIGPDATVILFVGRLVAKKRLAVVADACLRLTGDWHALVIGEGPERSVLARLGSRVTHVADLPFTRMPEAYATADLFTLPSRDEGTPLTVLEAMAAGLPCVLSDDPAFDELASCVGVLRVPANGAALAASLVPLAADPGRRSVIAAAARAWAEAHYGEERIASRYLELVAEVSAAGARARRASS
jgi:glycosyltransferase involved in cell wall biosynthesis